MSQPSPATITTLCDEWCNASATPSGGMSIGANTERFRLLANGVIFHDLNHEAMCAALIGLSKVLLRPGLNTVIDKDHFALWSWSGELLLGARSQLFPSGQREIKSLYEVALHAALAGCRKPDASVKEWQEHSRMQDQQPHHAKQFLMQATLALAYLAFPLLEAVLKRACATFVAFDGKILTPFTVQNKQGNSRNYDPQGGRDRQCSSLRDLLFLHYTTVADPNLKALLDRFRDHITLLDSTLDPFDLLYSWRNQSLHGSTNFQTIGGTVLNLSLLISLFEIRDNFEQHRAIVVEHCRWESELNHKSPWSFYPPY